MATETVKYTQGPPRIMGQVFAEVELSNASDYFRAAAGDIGANEVRSVTLPRVLVDTGATHISLPSHVVAQLGLRPVREVPLSTASGFHTTHVYEGLRVAVSGRSSIFECVELPGGDQALLGVVVLESLGLQPDILNHRLELRPESGPHGYISAY